MFILGLVVLFALGAWSLSWLTAVAVFGLLIGLAVGIVRMLKHMDQTPTPASKH